MTFSTKKNVHYNTNKLISY